MKKLLMASLAIALAINVNAQKKKKSETNSKYNSGLFSTLSFRSVGPAFTSGRVADIAVNPNNHSEYYLAVASGGVWKGKFAQNYRLRLWHEIQHYSVSRGNTQGGTHGGSL